MSNSVKFLILTSHRSGSTWLVDVLNHLPQTKAYSELFLPPAEKVRTNRPFFQVQSQTQAYLDQSIRSYPHYHYSTRGQSKIRPFSVYRYLGQLYAQDGTIGYKIMYGQLASFPEIWPYVMAKSISVIHLVRDNVLDIIISHEVRKMTRIAHTVAGERENLPAVQIELDLEDTLARMRSLQRHNQMARQLLDYTGVRHLETKYEELREDTANFLPIFEFLGHHDQRSVPQSELVKLVRTDYVELIRNYVELEERLAQTEFAGLLQGKRAGK